MPVYDEMSLFIMGFSFLFILSTSNELRESTFALIFDGDVRSILAGIMFFYGLGLSLFHVFSKSIKSDFTKYNLLTFAIIANASAGYVAGMNAWETSSGVLSIFPAWNILTAALLLIFWRYEIIDESYILDEDTDNLLEIFISFSLVLSILITCQFSFNMHWSEVYSICVVFASSVNPAISNIFKPVRITSRSS